MYPACGVFINPIVHGLSMVAFEPKVPTTKAIDFKFGMQNH